VTTYKIDINNILAADVQNQRAEIVIPFFFNNHPDLCPLSYQFSESGVTYSAYNDIITLGADERGLLIDAPLILADKLLNQTFDFYIRAVNKDGGEDFTHKIIVNKQPICVSKIEVLIEEREANIDNPDRPPESISEVFWVDELPEDATFFRYDLTSGFPQLDSDTFIVRDGECPLLFPYFIADFQDSEVEGNWVYYLINSDIVFAANRVNPDLSHFQIFPDSGGFQHTFPFEATDLRGIGIEYIVTFTLCGENFDIDDICYRPPVLVEEVEEEEEIVEEEVNAYPFFQFDPELDLQVESMYQLWRDIRENIVFGVASDFDVRFALPSVNDEEGDEYQIVIDIFEPYNSILKIRNNGVVDQLVVNMDLFYALGIQETDEQVVKIRGIIAVTDEENQDIALGRPGVYEFKIEFLPRGPWVAPVFEVEEEEVLDAAIILTREVDIRIREVVVVVEYGNIEEEFVREEPIVNELLMDADGNLKMSFTNEMDWPDNWVAKAETRNL